MKPPLLVLPILLVAGFLLSGPAHSAADRAAMETALRELPWRNIGPAIMGGRINDVAVVESRPATFYIATASGGAFKTVNKGTTWDAIFDDQATSSIGAIAVAPSDPDVVWLGTGESNNRQSSSWGNGVYRSTDGGKHWSHVGLEATMHIARVVVDPRSPETAYIAATGRLWGASPERGVYKTADAGKSWTRSLYVNDDTGCTDLVMDPGQPDTLYAAMYQRRRTPWGFNGGGPGSGIFRTTDGGANWTRLSEGLPAGDTGRIGLSVYRKDPRIIYALVENANGGIFRSDDSGTTWRKMSGTNPRPMYFSKVRVDPTDDRRVWVLGVSLAVSEDSGRTFRVNQSARMHADQHAFWIDPVDSSHILAGCDGGIQWSYDRGQTWDFVNNLPLAQFYEVAYDMRRPYWVYGGLQDNGSWGAPSSTLTVRGPTNEDWVQIGGGDGFYVQVDPINPDIVYVESQNGFVRRMNRATGEMRSIRPRPPAGEPPYRFDWNTPIVISPHDSKKILLGGNRLFISTDRGDSWRRSDDLSTQTDRARLPIMGVLPGPGVLSLNDGQSTYGQIVTVSESPVREGVIYAGTDDGNLHISRDDGRSWSSVAARVPGIPRGCYVSRVHASPHAAGRAYAAFDAHRGDDFHPYLFATEDFGETWRPLSTGLPVGSTVNVVRDHPRSENLLFAGTERGAYISVDRGRTWLRFPAPLPTVPVDDIQIHPRENDLILGTHGRGIWILDDIAPFERLSGEMREVDLCPPRSAIGFRTFSHRANSGNRIYIAPNAPAGALIQVCLRAKPAAAEPVSIAILDGNGRHVRSIPIASPAAGINRVTWDLRHDGVRLGSGAGRETEGGGPQRGRGGGGAARGGGFRSLPGPRALPGTYRVRLTAGKVVQEQPLVVDDDPRVRLSPGARKAHFAARQRLTEMLREHRDARRWLLDITAQLAALKTHSSYKASPQALRDAVAAADKRATEVQSRLSGGPAPATPAPGAAIETPAAPQPGSGQRGAGSPFASRIVAAALSLDGLTEPLSRSQRQEIEELDAELGRMLVEVRDFRKTLLRLNSALQQSALPPLRLESETPPPD